MATAVLISMAIIGAVALRVGLRGRVVDDHPLCAACGFDLTGRNPDGYRCNECGAGLGWPGSTVIGHRARRNGWFGAGLTLLVISIGGGVIVGSDGSIAFSLDQHLPLRVLLLIAEYGPGSGREAIAEIISRANSGTLSSLQISAAVETALQVQGNTRKTWDDRWGDLIEQARRSGKVTDQQWFQYARQGGAGGFAFRVRPRVRLGDPVPYWIDSKPLRGAAKSQLMLGVGIYLSTQGKNLPEYNMDCPFGRLFGAGSSGSSVQPAQYPKDFAPGERTVYARSTIVTGFYPYQKDVLPAGSEFADLTKTIEVLPASQPSVVAVPDPSLRDKIHDAISVDWQIASASPVNYNCNVTVNQTPVALSFDVYIRSGGTERKIGSLATAPRTQKWSWMMQTDGSLPMNMAYAVPPPLTGAYGTLILRSAPSPAINSVDVFNYWDGIVELKDIPIRAQ